MDAFCSNVGDDEGQKFRSLGLKKELRGKPRSIINPEKS